MENIWNAINAIGNFLLGVGTLVIGLAAYTEARKPDDKPGKRRKK
ncbi:hypothetical protein [Bifidobacterium miconisargentati]|nr:hypothetical protein [Bifidobacterium miconisargentati]